MTPIAANKSAPRLLNRHLPFARREVSEKAKAPGAANIPDLQAEPLTSHGVAIPVTLRG
jgi:hypothetical protein